MYTLFWISWSNSLLSAKLELTVDFKAKWTIWLQVETIETLIVLIAVIGVEKTGLKDEKSWVNSNYFCSKMYELHVIFTRGSQT